MSKRVKMTDEIGRKLRASIGDPSADLANFVVYEARMLTTEPLRRKGGLFARSRISHSTLTEMADFLAKDGNAVPLHIMHDQSSNLPVGRVFAGRVQSMPNGETELRGMFYLPLEEKDAIAKIDNSVVDEVSVGLETKHLYCSECNWDFKGADSTLMNLYTCTCPNDHTVGENGMYLRGVGMESFFELSLVSRGAAQGAKILSRALQSMGQEKVERLAASGMPAEATVLIASYEMENSENQTNEGESKMDKETLALLNANATELATAKLQLDGANAKNTALEAQVADLTAKLSAKDDEVKTLKAAAEQAQPGTAELQAQLDAKTKELADATEKLAPHVKAALVASGTAEAEVPATLIEMAAVVEAKGLKLHQVVGSEPTAIAAKDDVSKKFDHRKGAFKLSNNQ